jgi:hypothetical protein
MFNFLVITALLFLARLVALKTGSVKYPYPTMFFLSALLAYSQSKSLVISLFTGLTILIGRIVYRYLTTEEQKKKYNDIIFIIGTLLSLYMGSKLENTETIRKLLLVQFVYLLSSIYEWIGHKYVMHCYMFWPWLENTECKLAQKFKKNCIDHKNHHTSVNTDMTLKNEPKDPREIYFSWFTILYGPLLILPFTYILNKSLDLNLSFKFQIGTVFLFGLIFGLIWNGLHARMHKKNPNTDMAIGPPGLHIQSNLLYNNHEIHHAIKGEDKGNYNVIYLGADELFGTNNIK